MWREKPSTMSFEKPFPPEIGSRLLGGCLALEWPADGGELAVSHVDMNRIPILYRSKLNGRHQLCTDMVNRIKELDKECEEKRKQGVQCPSDQFHDLIGKPLCDYYEGELGMFLAECDCIKRDRVPELADVLKACRDKATAEDAQIKAGTKLESRRVMGTKDEPQKLCDVLERYRAVNISEFGMSQIDYFNHILSRYMLRSGWRDVMSKALDERDNPPSPFCVFGPCGNIDSNLVHISAQGFRRDVPRNCDVSMCSLNIGRVGASGGTMEIRDNIVDINCSGGAKCSVDQETSDGITQRIISGNTAEGDYTYTASDRTLKCGKFGKCQPNGTCKCDTEWTGPDCKTKRKAEAVVVDDDPFRPPDTQPYTPAPAPAPAVSKSSLLYTLIAGASVAGVLLLLGIKYMYISKQDDTKQEKQ